jgi:HSP20 family molecular chaperone IbpA
MKQFLQEYPVSFKSVRPSGPAISMMRDNCATSVEPVFTTVYKRRVATNPCSELIFDWSDMNKEIDRTPHSRRNYENGIRANGQVRGSILGRSLRADVEINDYNVLISMELPGVEQERISVRRIDDVLRVTVRPEDTETVDVCTQQYNSKVIEYILDPLEVVEHIELDLGVLTIVTTRGTDVEDYEID